MRHGWAERRQFCTGDIEREPPTGHLGDVDPDTGRVNPAVAQRIRAVAAELGYLPNMHAHGLRTKQISTFSAPITGTPSMRTE
ncbi:helix-turn-helix domain-containing protein [Ruania alkalisoli]|uniref:Helix-turn-helix domain-containing protein n=1 Tax=Ruania alkalisoli TaxID=2779775 RepID=A0A7M1SSP9_9MICO|nr:helix-turn-helix domain-containing protein [Ruania alkalisoli]QOR70598.1 helix-turn-helix domain-containing protein [Ruania alkalisoli]